MEQELERLYASPKLPELAPSKKRADRVPPEGVRRMADHMLPAYAEANFRIPAFVFTRTPKIRDFPRERLYTRESIDLLFRYYYKSTR